MHRAKRQLWPSLRGWSVPVVCLLIQNQPKKKKKKKRAERGEGEVVFICQFI